MLQNLTTRRRSRITVTDVAQLAGVAKASVSRVMNNVPTVSSDICVKVRRAAKALNYRPSWAAKTLADNKHQTIGLVTEVESAETSYGAQLVCCLAVSVAVANYRLTVGAVHYNADAGQIENLPFVKTHSVDGLILDVHTMNGNIDAILAGCGLPYVFINPSRPRHHNSVMPDDVAVARRATDYLIERGHRRIGYIPAVSGTNHCSQPDRMRGYSRALIAADLRHMPLWDKAMASSKVGKTFSPVDANYLARLELLWKEGCTAIVTYNGLEALRSQQGFSRLGIRVPQDVSIMSCDYEPITTVMLTPITCIELSRRGMGDIAIEMLQERIANGNGDVASVFIKGDLREGSSVETLSR